jgi:hypothetical protein
VVLVGLGVGLGAVGEIVDVSIVGSTMVVFECPVEQIATLGSKVFKDLLWRRFALVERADLVRATRC